MGIKKHLCVCQNCGKTFQSWYSSRGKYCSNKCSSEAYSRSKYQKIIDGDPSIMRGNYSPTNVAYKYIMQEQSYKCAICGIQNKWNGNDLLFIVDHIDGDAANNIRSNLRCICPNCDAQLPTYKNTGKRKSSRTYRKVLSTAL